MWIVFSACFLVNDREPNGPGEPTEPDTTEPAPPPACVATGIAAAGVTFDLPATSVPGAEYPYAALFGFSDLDNCEDNQLTDLAVSTTDLTGDGVADVVFTRDDCGDTLVGRRRWTVHRGTGAGYGEPETWVLPDTAVPGTEYPYASLSGGSDADNCEDNQLVDLVMTTTDLTGDGVADLVFTRDDCGDTLVGRRRWTVHRGTGSGYGEPETWVLPETAVPGTEYPYAGLSGFSDADNCGNGSRADLAVTTTDLTGDGVPDIVFTRDDCGDTQVGRTRWIVHRGTGDGYGAPETWELPATAVPGNEYPYAALAGYSLEDNCGSGSILDLAVTTADLTGDGVPDLVFTRDDCGDPQVGRTRWTVHRGTGDGFGDAETWELPETAVHSSEYPYAALFGSSTEDNCGTDYRADFGLSTFDLTGDRIPDLVVTRDDCGTVQVGRQEWTVYRGTGSGYGAAETWELPDQAVPPAEYPYASPSGFSTEDNCGTGYRTDLAVTTADLTGDGQPDLVVTRDDCGETAVGRRQWTVYPGECAP